MASYEVTVPFEALVYEQVTSATTAELPASFELPGGISVSRTSEVLYLARLVVTASDVTDAKVKGVEIVREILSLFATWNDGFRLHLGSGLNATRLFGGEEQRASPVVREDRGGVVEITVRDTIAVEVQGFLSAVKKRGSVEFERAALEWRLEWPPWLPTVLELNYLAVASHDPKVALMLHWSALEVLIAGVEGRPRAILQRLEDEESQALIAEMRQALERYGIQEDSVGRMIARVQDSQEEGAVQWIARGLRTLGLQVEEAVVRATRRQRGAVTHAGAAASEELKKAANEAREWVQQALRNILERRVP